MKYEKSMTCPESELFEKKPFNRPLILLIFLIENKCLKLYSYFGHFGHFVIHDFRFIYSFIKSKIRSENCLHDEVALDFPGFFR